MKRRTALILLVVVCLVSVVFLITGIVLFAKSSRTHPQELKETPCDYSEEAKRVSLDEFLQKVQRKYYELHPHLFYLKPGVTVSEVRKHYKAYDPAPLKIKQRTDEAMELLDEISSKKISTEQLKPREKKAVSQVKFFLKQVFSDAYDGNYYAGTWLLGPDLLCYKAMCNFPYELENNLRYFNPSNVAEFELFRDKLIEANVTIWQYIENLRAGVKSGMVRSRETCQAGLQSLATKFTHVFRNGERGILKEHFVQVFLETSFFSGMENEIQELMLWRRKYNDKSVQDSMEEFIVEYIGKPINSLFRFLETEYQSHCVPSDVSSGLGSLPVSYVYTNGKPDKNQPTVRKLPTGELLNGSRAYELIMPYFTTNSMTPDEVHQVGEEVLNQLYPEALEIAREVTGQTNNETAKSSFIKRLNQSDMYYSDVIPANESDARAHELCQSRDSARKHCPVRWSAMEKWFEDARQIMSLLDEKTINMFYFTGKKKTTPSCPLKLEPDFLPVSGAQSYLGSDASCQYPASYYIPFFLDRLGPRFEEWSVNSHEARPGHHTQDQGNKENFQDPCGGVIAWLQDVTGDSYVAFGEGWGLYAENPLIAQETDVYEDEPFQKYGMLKWQIWRALRLIVDTGLHHRGMTRLEALEMFAKYAWATGDTAEKEVTRYQSNPGQATAYMIGQRHILRLRQHAQKELDADFNLKDFHYQVLSQGLAPLDYLDDHIRKYVECVKKNTKAGCEGVVKSMVEKPPKPREHKKGKRRDFIDKTIVVKPIRKRYL